jgi:uncharacterized protein YkwD
MRRTTRILLTASLAVGPVIGLAGPAALTTPAAATGGVHVLSVHLNGFEAKLAADINNSRRSAGLRPLTVIAGATDVARRWSWQMADVQSLYHNPSIVSDITRAGSSAWTEIAENVGEGPSDDPANLFQAYMDSPPHRANILDPAARYLGVGTVERDGIAWNTLDFTNAYSNGYGLTRVPAAGLTMDAQTITSTTDVAMLNTTDQRFAAAHTGGVSASRLGFTGARVQNGSAYTWLHRSGRRPGHAGMMMRDALNLRHATKLCLQISARAANGAKVPVHVSLRQTYGSNVRLGTVPVSGRTQWIDLTLPAGAKTFRNVLLLHVNGAALSKAGGKVRLAVYDVRAEV